MWFFQTRIRSQKFGSLAIFQGVYQKHVVFPNSNSKSKNLAVWRFSRGFVRNMWFFQTQISKSKIWQFGDFQGVCQGKIPKSIDPPHSASLSTTLSTLCCCESHPCVTHCFPPQFQHFPPYSHKSRLIFGNIETFHCYPAPFHKTTKPQIIPKLLRLLSVVTRTLK